MLLEALERELAERQAQGLLRRRRLLESAQGTHIKVDGRDALSFCSNDYLGLANHPAIITAVKQAADSAGVGSGASHLVTGHHQLHHDLELALAAFVGAPRALLFSSGYMANMGAVTALVGRGDEVFADKLNHASLNDAALLSRADFKRYAHNDMAALQRLLATSKAKRKLVLVDAVFSMDGDIALVPELLALCERHDAWLMLDDAHGFGVLGKDGKGVLQHFDLTKTNPELRDEAQGAGSANSADSTHQYSKELSTPQRRDSPAKWIGRIIYMATLGKAAGVSGAFVAGDATLIEYLIQNARTHIYTTATPPLLAAGVLASLQVIEQESQRREHLQTLIAALRAGLKQNQWRLADSSTAIQPLIIGSNDEALYLSERLLEQGILVPAIRPPTVPKGSARLRISLSAAHSLDDVAQLTEALNELAH